MEEDFYATLKLKTGEEVFSKVMPCTEDDNIFLLVSNPITFSEVTSRNGSIGYKIEPWLKTSKEDLFIIDMEDIITISESKDFRMITMYQSWVRDVEEFKYSSNNKQKINRKMGYISTVNDAKEMLEKIFKNS